MEMSGRDSTKGSDPSFRSDLNRISQEFMDRMNLGAQSWPNMKLKMATVSVNGCSGCHMSLLDLDERIIELCGKFKLVYSPFMNGKEYPEDVDLALVEGAIASYKDLRWIRLIRERTRYLVSLGNCAVSGGKVPPEGEVREGDRPVRCSHIETGSLKIIRSEAAAGGGRLLQHPIPLHEAVKVDLYLPGCPPPADMIYHVLSEMLAGRDPGATALKDPALRRDDPGCRG